MKKQKGITLIALIITIIVMLILVGVSVSVALNTGLFESAQSAAQGTEAEKEKETALSNGTINLQGIGETDLEGYVNSLNKKQYKMVIDASSYADSNYPLASEETEFTYTFEEGSTWGNMMNLHSDSFQLNSQFNVVAFKGVPLWDMTPGATGDTGIYPDLLVPTQGQISYGTAGGTMTFTFSEV